MCWLALASVAGYWAAEWCRKFVEGVEYFEVFFDVVSYIRRLNVLVAFWLCSRAVFGRIWRLCWSLSVFSGYRKWSGWKGETLSFEVMEFCLVTLHMRRWFGWEKQKMRKTRDVGGFGVWWSGLCLTRQGDGGGFEGCFVGRHITWERKSVVEGK